MNRNEARALTYWGGSIVHQKTGNKYSVRGHCKGKVNGVWLSGMLYERAGKTYWRAWEDFEGFSEAL